MVFSEKADANKEGFLNLLELTKTAVLDVVTAKEITRGDEFEEIVFEKMIEAAVGTEFENTIKRTTTHAFPDIVANKYFGIEVKLTIEDKWKSIGNSVLESLREEVEKIYIFFGKMGGEKDIRYRLYQECLPDVSVTHSPRYKIDMELPAGESIFEKINIGYDSLRNEDDPIRKFKKYYRSKLKEGEELWWMDKEESSILKNFKTLSEKEKNDFMADCMILFPEIFGNRQTKFERAAAYLITSYSAYTSNLRDNFTAGGQEDVVVMSKTHRVPQIAGKLFEYAKDIKRRFLELDPSIFAEYWESDVVPGNPEEKWKEYADQNFAVFGADVNLSDIYEAGLK